MKQKKMDQQLIKAVERNDVQEAGRLIKQGANPEVLVPMAETVWKTVEGRCCQDYEVVNNGVTMMPLIGKAKTMEMLKVLKRS